MNEDGDLEIAHLDDDQPLAHFPGHPVTGMVAEVAAGVDEDGGLIVHEWLE